MYVQNTYSKHVANAIKDKARKYRERKDFEKLGLFAKYSGISKNVVYSFLCGYEVDGKFTGIGYSYCGGGEFYHEYIYQDKYIDSENAQNLLDAMVEKSFTKSVFKYVNKNFDFNADENIYYRKPNSIDFEIVNKGKKITPFELPNGNLMFKDSKKIKKLSFLKTIKPKVKLELISLLVRLRQIAFF